MKTSLVWMLCLALLAGCSDDDPVTRVDAGAVEPRTLHFTHQRSDGNRVTAAVGSLPDATVTDIPLGGTPSWLVAAPLSGASLWVVALEDGSLRGFRVSDAGEVSDVAVPPGQLPPGMPPVLAVAEDGTASVLAPLSATTSPLASLLERGEPDGASLLSVDESGDLTAHRDGAELYRVPLQLLPDARLLMDEQGRVAALAGATTRYDHGVLGDSIEASRVVVLTGTPLTIAGTTEIPDPAVVEGLSPIWADVGGGAERELVVTESDAQLGSRIVVFSEQGQRLAESTPIGQGYRWRHPIAVAPFGPNGELEIAVVKTPHIGGIAEFFRLEAGALTLEAEAGGVSSHSIGSRDLDQALAGDLDGDGAVELLVPDQAHTKLVAVRRTVGGAGIVWSLELGATLATNLNLAERPDGLVLGAGLASGTLRLWRAKK